MAVRALATAICVNKRTSNVRLLRKRTFVCSPTATGQYTIAKKSRDPIVTGTADSHSVTHTPPPPHDARPRAESPVASGAVPPDGQRECRVAERGMNSINETQMLRSVSEQRKLSLLKHM
jgi:hypothetical protein